MKKILYICPSYPFPANNGGEIAWLEHIKELSKLNYKYSIKYFLFNNNLEKTIVDDQLKINPDIFPKKVIRRTYIYKFFRKIFHIIFSKYTTFMKLATDKDIKKSILDYNPDLVILDGIAMYANLPKNKFYKLIYIAHNIEYDYECDLARLEKNPIKKIGRYINSFKTKLIERELIQKSDKIICISTSDYKYFKNLYQEKVDLIPHKVQFKDEKWQGDNHKTLFFCGAMDFYPNREAIEWIVNELSPMLPEDIKIKISGKGTEKIPKERKKDNIEFLGFVSKEELFDLYKTSSAFICPIVYGSGVKIKVTEALSYGMPIIATKESLEGLDYINIKPLIDRNNLKQTKNNIEDILQDKTKLQEYNLYLIEQIKNFNNNNEVSLEKIIGDCLDEQ